MQHLNHEFFVPWKILLNLKQLIFQFLLKLISFYFLSIKYSTIAKLSKAINVPKINTPITIIIFVLKIKAPRLL